jgi:pimeloyl-ACP methyl ester carboxylesterase
MRAVLSIFTIGVVLSSVTACTTIVEERNFIRPDKLSGFKSEQTFNTSKLPPAAKVDEQSIKTGDGVELKGLTVHQPGATVTVLYFGGNHFHIDEHAIKVLPILSSCGANSAVFDYRGYGRSQGEPTIANMKSDALRIFDFVNGQNPGKVIVHGHSLGGMVAGYVAQQRPALGLVLESTANNVQDWANANLPWYAKPFLSLEINPALSELDNTQTSSKVTGASLVMVGDQDKVTPPELGKKVFDSIPSPSKKMLVIAGAGHMGVLAHPDTTPAYCDFITKLTSRN